jgi:hypothetical protein
LNPHFSGQIHTAIFLASRNTAVEEINDATLNGLIYSQNPDTKTGLFIT